MNKPVQLWTYLYIYNKTYLYWLEYKKICAFMCVLINTMGLMTPHPKEVEGMA